MESEKMDILDWIIAALFGATTVAIALQVFFRYILNNSLTWSEEISRYLFTWITFLGAAAAIRENQHVVIDFIVVKLPPTWRKTLEIGVLALVLVFKMVVAYFGFLLVGMTAGTLSPALALPLNLVFYASLPAAFLVGIVYTAIRIKHVLEGSIPPEAVR
jgi:TRAP-type transport system small permease protein